MGDDDVICLSSDDETSPAEPQTKKSKIVEEPIKRESESFEYRRDSNLKRKPSSRNGDAAGVPKKPRLSANGDVEEITVESSRRSTNGESKLRASADSRESSKSSSSRSDWKRSERRDVGASSSDVAGSRKEEKSRHGSQGIRSYFVKSSVGPLSTDAASSKKEETRRLGAQGIQRFSVKSSDARPSSGHREAEKPRSSGGEASSVARKDINERAGLSRSLGESMRRRVENLFGIVTNAEPVPSTSPPARTFEKLRDKVTSVSNDARPKSSGGSFKVPEREAGECVAGSSKSSRGSTDSRTSREDSSRTSKRHEHESKSHRRAKVPEKSSEATSRHDVAEKSVVIVDDNDGSRLERSKRCSEDKTKERPSNSRRSSPSTSPKGSSSKSVRTHSGKSSSERSSKSSPSSKRSPPEVEIVAAAKTSRSVDDDVTDVPRPKDKSSSARHHETSGSKASSADISRTPRSSPKKHDAGERKERTSPSTSSKPPLVKSVAILSRRIQPTNLTVTGKSSEAETKPRSESKDDGSPKSRNESKDDASSKPRSQGKDDWSSKRRSQSKDDWSSKRRSQSKDDWSSKPRSQSKDDGSPKPRRDSKDDGSPKPRRDSKDDGSPKPRREAKDDGSPKSRSQSKDNGSPKSRSLSKDDGSPKSRSQSKDDGSPKSRRELKDDRSPKPRRESKDNGSSKPRSESKDDGSPKSSRDRERSAEAFEPIAGCSKTPDEVFADASRSSSTRDESKPHLVVKTKEPVVSAQQDTFAMFLSLCLQTDRSPQMEKIVAKLKRNYEQLEPAYARSRLFLKLVNKTREKISTHGRVYYYIGHVADEMKLRRRRDRSSKTSRDKETIAENGEDEAPEDPADKDEELYEDSRESRRLRDKIKTIETAMKKCSRKIEELEVAEVDFDDDNNSHYIMLERYKEKMIELYAKLCEYTNEHADAGRAYLRPKHLRVCQIPSIDQAINSFVNSKLSSNRKKTQSGKSFVDGLIFPDYIDILECVTKVNDEQKLGLDKRRQQKLAEEAFTSLGKYLQDARQKDYWDTFSLHLEDSKDPATMDPALSEKLQQNRAIAEKNTREIFEKYVRKQEEGNASDEESSDSGTDDEDDDDDDDGDDDEDNGKKSNCEVSDVVLSDTDNDDKDDANAAVAAAATAEDSDEKGDNDGSSRILETITESARITADSDLEEQATRTNVEDPTNDNNATSSSKDIIEVPANSTNQREETLATNEPMEIEESSSEAQSPTEQTCERVDDELTTDVRREEDATSENNNVLKTSETRTEDPIAVPDESEEVMIENETTKNEVNPSEESAPAAGNESVTEPPRILRIRSFAKPPSSWASSQEFDNTENTKLAAPAVSRESETIDLLDDDSITLDESTTSKISETSLVPRPQQQQQQQQQPALNGSSRVYAPSKLVKIVPKVDTSLPKQFALLPGVKIVPVNGQGPQQRNGQPAQHSVTKPAGKTVTINFPRNVKFTAIPPPSAPNPAVNVRVCSLEKSQRIELRVAKNLRTLPPGQLKVVKLSDKSGLARANGAPDNTAPIPLRPRPPPNPTQTNQTLQIQPVTNMQGLRLRVTPNTQILQQSKAQQQQILRFSNGQLVKTSAASIRPLQASVTALATPVASQPRGITIHNPRLVRLPGNALAGATVARRTESGQLRVERIENNANSRSQRLVNGGSLDNASRNAGARPTATTIPRSPREQRTNPLHKSRTAR